MADLFKTLLKASRLARKKRPISAALEIQSLFTAPTKKPKGKRVKAPLRIRSGEGSTAAVHRVGRPPPASFIDGEFKCAQGSLQYKFYTPTGSTRRRMPLLVMLHGCSQSAGDFAAGTGMNRLADELGLLVLYPQQSPSANLGRCWNWHSQANQSRGGGEPAAIAALTRHAIMMGRANPARVYIAGISAGGAAAAIIGAAYPDIYVAVGVHSGVAREDIRSLGAALSAMRGKRMSDRMETLPRQLPTIVFHGDEDHVVHPSNAGGFLRNIERSRAGPLLTRTFKGSVQGGRNYTYRVYKDRTGETLLEDWTVHGSGHSWSGGSAAGSYTDPRGPDASREMARFFLERRRVTR